MSNLIGPSPLRILHVLTLNSKNGEYGGPVRVARELCGELNNRGYITEIFSGALKGSEPIAFEGINESYILVKPITKRFRLSSLWSWKLIPALNQRIKRSDIVHIHFARDIILFLTAILCVLNKKKFVTQTHGMIISDQRHIIKIIDVILTIPIWKKSSANFVLTEQELSYTSNVYKNSKSKILPNGLSIDQDFKTRKVNENIVVAFCSRLNPIKRVDKFLAIAESQLGTKIIFEIYGPDGGELENIIEHIRIKGPSFNTTYEGALSSEKVVQKLSEIDLIVLPSDYDPFPMVILEALSVGTPVLVMPTCGFAAELAGFNADFVSEDNTIEGLIRTFERLVETVQNLDKKEIKIFCEKTFSIAKVCDELANVYIDITKNHA